jgi:hypothetical protein
MPIIVNGQTSVAEEQKPAPLPDRSSGLSFSDIRKMAESKVTARKMDKKTDNDNKLISYKDSVFISDMTQSSKE